MEEATNIVFVYKDKKRADTALSQTAEYVESRENLHHDPLLPTTENRSSRELSGTLSGFLQVDDPTGVRELYGTARSLLKLIINAEDLIASDGDQVLASAVELVQTIYDLTAPQYVFGHTKAELDYFGVDNVDWGGLDHPIDENALAAHRVAQPMWLMLLPPAMVETYGRDWLHDLPADRVEDLDDGAVLVVGVEDFTDCDSEIEFGQRIDEARFALEEAFEDAPVS